MLIWKYRAEFTYILDISRNPIICIKYSVSKNVIWTIRAILFGPQCAISRLFSGFNDAFINWYFVTSTGFEMWNMLSFQLGVVGKNKQVVTSANKSNLPFTRPLCQRTKASSLFKLCQYNHLEEFHMWCLVPEWKYNCFKIHIVHYKWQLSIIFCI